MELKKLNVLNGPLVPGTLIDKHTFIGQVPTATLFNFAPDPRESESEALRKKDPLVRELFEIRKEVQRLFKGKKAENVPKYGQYLVDVQVNGMDGAVPTMILWTKEELEVETFAPNPIGFVQIPADARLVAIDGETQLAARYFAAQNISTDIRKVPVTVLICHGRSVEWARQAFYDLNVKGVAVNLAVSLSMDNRDVITRVARHVEVSVPLFKGRVNYQQRQLSAKSTDLFTITALRGACTTFSEGISGVKYGTENVPVSEEKLAKLEPAAVDWFSLIADSFGEELQDRQSNIIGNSTVLAAIGAVGSKLVEIEDVGERATRAKELIALLKQVNWTKGKHWEGIAGKFTPSGQFSVGGTKETAHAVYKALTDPTFGGFQQIRVTTAHTA